MIFFRWCIAVLVVASGLWWLDHMHQHIGYALLRVAMGGMLGWFFDSLLFTQHGELDECEHGVERAAVLVRRGLVVGLFALATAMVV